MNSNDNNKSKIDVKINNTSIKEDLNIEYNLKQYQKSGIYINNNDLRKIQMIQLDMLKEVDRICRKHNIKYFIDGGTLLGAVRNGGFIPWDNDADVSLLRKDYEKLIEVMKVELNTDKYYLQDHRNTEGYRWSYAKLRRKNTEYIRTGQEHLDYESGVFIDIMAYDKLPNTKFARMLVEIPFFVVRKILYSEVGYKSDKSKIKRFVYSLLRKIPKQVSFNLYYAIIDLYKDSNKKFVFFVSTPATIYSNKDYGFPIYWFESVKEISFEGHMFYGLTHYDEYLSALYGENYLELPPIDKRTIPMSISSYDISKIDDIYS